MKSKSIVQERLEAGRNRLEIINREVEAQRMTVPVLGRGLRDIGKILESVQKMVTSDKDVKFQVPINQRLDAGMNRISGIIRTIEGSGMKVDDLNANLNQVTRAFDSIQEFVDLEIETLA